MTLTLARTFLARRGHVARSGGSNLPHPPPDAELAPATKVIFTEKDAWKFLHKLMIKEDQFSEECRKSSRLEETLNSTRAQLALANAKIAGTLAYLICLDFLIPSDTFLMFSSMFIFEELTQKLEALKAFIKRSR